LKEHYEPLQDFLFWRVFCWHIFIRLIGLLAVFYRVCGFEPVSIGVYELVPDDEYIEGAWS
jgi:hypothetical protein